MAINLIGLNIELSKAGIAHNGCNTDGLVWGPDGSEIQTRPDVAAVVSAHNKANWDALELSWISKRTTARIAAKDIPGWATWTQAQLTAWCDANLMTDAQIDATTLSADLKKNIKALNAFCRNAGTMIRVLRDDTYPDLSEYAGGVINSTTLK